MLSEGTKIKSLKKKIKYSVFLSKGQSQHKDNDPSAITKDVSTGQKTVQDLGLMLTVCVLY